MLFCFFKWLVLRSRYRRVYTQPEFIHAMRIGVMVDALSRFEEDTHLCCIYFTECTCLVSPSFRALSLFVCEFELDFDVPCSFSSSERETTDIYTAAGSGLLSCLQVLMILFSSYT